LAAKLKKALKRAPTLRTRDVRQLASRPQNLGALWGTNLMNGSQDATATSKQSEKRGSHLS